VDIGNGVVGHWETSHVHLALSVVVWVP
jgi:DNA mismatch repair protein MutH